jgi:hypothetical protein
MAERYTPKMSAVLPYVIAQNKMGTEVVKGYKFYIVAYLLKARTVGAEKQPLLGNALTQQ